MIEVKDAPYMSGWDDVNQNESFYEEELDYLTERRIEEEREGKS